MRNFPVKIEDKEYWISRSMAVAVFVFDPITRSFLAVKRGEGCPDNVGKWCCPCGYLDYDETLQDAAYRELHEETGLEKEDVSQLRINHIDDNINSNRQNVTVIYDCVYYHLKINPLTTKYSEPNEIGEIKWIPAPDIDKYQWAFDHDKIIKSILSDKKNL